MLSVVLPKLRCKSQVRSRFLSKRYFSDVTSRPQTRVAVALSGGVDSSVTAYLLLKQGYKVTGLHMSNWSSEEEGHCNGNADLKEVQKICTYLGIDFKILNFEKEYWNFVFQPFLQDYERGVTPNPDVLCNREIKFKHLVDAALKQGADFLATGHYARLRLSKNGNIELLQATDKSKDQTYFLTQVPEYSFKRVLFPIGNMLKKEVRNLARVVGLPNAERRDSVGLCFVGKRKFRRFLAEYLPKKPGKFVDVTDGSELAEHEGVSFYTIGQRAPISGSDTKHYVVRKDLETNTIFVCSSNTHPGLYCDELVSDPFHWIAGAPPIELLQQCQLQCQAKVRHQPQSTPVTIHWEPNQGQTVVKLRFMDPQRSVALGQVLALYMDEVCLGGGLISALGPSYYDMKKPLPKFSLEQRELTLSNIPLF